MDRQTDRQTERQIDRQIRQKERYQLKRKKKLKRIQQKWEKETSTNRKAGKNVIKEYRTNITRPILL